MPVTSGSSVELRLLRGGEPLERVEIGRRRFSVFRARLETAVKPTDEVHLVRGGGLRDPGQRRMRLTLLGNSLFVLDPALTSFGGPVTAMAGTSGDVELVIEEECGGGWRRLAVVVAEVAAPPALQALRPRLITALSSIGEPLALDAYGQLDRSATGRVATASMVLDRLEEFDRELRLAARAIRQVARSTQARTVETRRPRPGDVIRRPRRVRFGATLANDGELVVRPERVVNLRTRPSFDLEEHRQFAHGLEVIASMARSVEQEMAELDADAIDAGPEDRLRERSLAAPELARQRGRREQGRLMRGRARWLAARVQGLRGTEPWLTGVSPPRTALRPTPTFRRVPAYARAYRTLLDLQDLNRTVGHAVLDRFKTTPELFEAWVFIRTCLTLAEIVEPEAVGAVRDRLSELRHGDVVELAASDTGLMTVRFEPVIPTLDDPSAPVTFPFRAALSNAPLRPDVWIEARAPGGAARVAVLDAKCSARFRSRGGSGSVGDELERMRDYRSRVVDPSSGHQPVRAAFQVHYLAGERTVCNVRQFFTGAAPPEAYLTGAVGAAPGEPVELDRVLRRLVDWLFVGAKDTKE